jgi:hypothetical protein
MPANREHTIIESTVRRRAMSLLMPVALVASCSYGPAPVRPPAIDAVDAGSLAMEQYDADDDGFLAGDELDQVPGLKAAMETLDVDKDGKVTEDEIAARIHVWQSSRIGVAAVLCVVTMNGQPLARATVTFEPESFLGEELQTASGVTDDFGNAYPTIPKHERPTPDMPPGLRLGFYRVKVSKTVNGKEMIPAIYNAETTLGQQIAPDDPALLRHKIVLNLKST